MGPDDVWFKYLEDQYGQPWRRYHTIDHINSMLSLCGRYAANLDDPKAVELAIWFHDVIYDPKATHGDNELKSIEEFNKYAVERQLSVPQKTAVAELIHSTIKHEIPGELTAVSKNDLSYFLDFDLEVLSRDKEAYEIYAAQIRQEYWHYSDEAYGKGRTAVLETFLRRDKAYFTEAFRTAGHETVARWNLAEEIRRLS
ncbi:hypothetical protein JAAARDRAFT_384709 [Jaapia argillacea MUCL 33604]|uniref:HD domain-containing protein n=1 Tax=Jaapia argillacea MUCL 33604 TaxID=933084 RepID=A0A067Q9H4_9AGAM|nr:hypothetical protein JAAARDRAFT_384709 [Jaapia argillacea MUCL 33604]